MKVTIRNHMACDCQELPSVLTIENDHENHHQGKRYTCANCGGDLGEQHMVTLPEDLSAMLVALLRRYSFSLFRSDTCNVWFQLDGVPPQLFDRANVLYLRNRILNDLSLKIEIFDMNPLHYGAPALPELPPVEPDLLTALPKSPVLGQLVDFLKKLQFVPIGVSRRSRTRYIRWQRCIRYDDFHLYFVRIEIDWQLD